MIKFFTLALVTLSLSGFTAFADDNTGDAAAAGSLEHNMKEAGRLFKAIGGTIKDSSKNAENAVAAGKMSELFKLSKEQTPDHFQDIPDSKKADAFKGYQEMIQKVIDLSDQLQQAFLSNDNAGANEIYLKMKDLKQEGHDEYDP